jgi:hypothetical protein
MKIALVGNCQTETLRRILKVSLPGTALNRLTIEDALKTPPKRLLDADHILLQSHPRLAPLEARLRNEAKVVRFANISFNGYHPDMLGLRAKDGKSPSLIVSNIVLWSYLRDLSPQECMALFCESFVSRLNYRQIFDVARAQLVKSLDAHGMAGQYWFDRWHARSPFMLNVGHPKLFVMNDLARYLCSVMGVDARRVDVASLVANQGLRGEIFPTYNQDRDPDNSLVSPHASYVLALKCLDTAGYVSRSYAMLKERLSDHELNAARGEIFDKALAEHRAATSTTARVNPYGDLPPTSYWRTGVVDSPRVFLDGFSASAHPVIGKQTRVATAGSCFAQHISRVLNSKGLNYYVAETAPPEMPGDEAQRRHYGVFSARYGNVYTARQLLQLVQRAFGRFQPAQDVWESKDEGFLDPFRPNLAETFTDRESVLRSRDEHLAAVRTMFTSLDVMVFTLGLTESWINLGDGATYPVAPGVVSRHEDYKQYAFKNFSLDEIVEDMSGFLGLLAAVNPKAQVILTVSPVPLVATYEPEHVLSATTYSKSVLRTAARQLARTYDNVQYFPSYEIITGQPTKGRYYETDLRSIKPEGVEHVMDVFLAHMVNVTSSATSASPAKKEAQSAERAMVDEMRAFGEVVCDEELIERK